MAASKKSNSTKKLWTPLRIAFTIVVLSLFAAFGISSCTSRDEKRPAPPASVRVEPKAPPRNVPPAALTSFPASVTEAELKALTGAPIKLSSYAGKVLVVNLWATWCGPCRQETPELVKFYKEYRSQGFEVVGLSTENPEASAAAVRQFVQDFNVDYRIGWATAVGGTTGDVAITLMQGRDAIPQSFVIARNGRIVKRFVGFNVVNTPPQIKEAIQEALKESSTGD
jgi:thiol-disulfide isomerase/thioredoxin